MLKVSVSGNMISCQKPIPQTLSIAVRFPFIVVVDATDALYVLYVIVLYVLLWVVIRK